MVSAGATVPARRVPTWAAGLLARLSQDQPVVLTRDDLQRYLDELGMDRPVGRTIDDLRRLGWLVTLRVQGAWAFVPMGQEPAHDRYLDLQAWRVRDQAAVFALAGEAAAWQLGYVAREFQGPIALWVPRGVRPPFGLRPVVSVIRLGWSAEIARQLPPRPALLHKRGLDLTRWADGLPAFGPEALMVQLACRPASFRAWPDLVERLSRLAIDCDLDRLELLVSGQSTSCRQRAAYLLHRGGRHDEAVDLLNRRSTQELPEVVFGEGAPSVWSREFNISDRLIAPMQGLLGKA